MNNNLAQHLASAEWKEAMDSIADYFEGLTHALDSNIQGYCQLLHAKKQNWDLTKMIEKVRKVDIDNIESAFWWEEWTSLLETLESQFSIRFPKPEDYEPYVERDGSFTRIAALNYEMTVEKLAQVVSLLCADELVEEREFFHYEQCEFEDSYSSVSPWSESLRQITEGVLLNLPIGSFFQGYCVLKSLDGRFAKITVEDASSDLYILRDMDSGEPIMEFPSIQKLIQAGWVVD